MTQKILSVILIGEQELSLNAICNTCASSAEWSIKQVEESALEPVDYLQTQWRFSGNS